MMLCHYITPKNIIAPLQGTTKKELLEFLTKELADLNKLKNHTRLMQSIMDREVEGTTFLPTGIAIPHARIPDVTDIPLVMGVIPDGYKESEDSFPTYLIILFFSPIKEKEFGRHLKLLSKIAAVFHDPLFVKEVASLKSPEEIFEKIQQKEREIAE